MEAPVTVAPRTAATDAKLRFAGGNQFHLELRRRVDEFFRDSGKHPRDCPQMYFKTAIIIASFFLSYILLVFVADTWWQAAPAALMMALSVGAIGFNVMHDGGHKAYSDRQWINNLMAMSLDLVGASSYVWRWKHSVLHHTYVNIQDYDSDVDLGIIARCTPHQKRLGFQRWQHWYIWLLYGIMTVRWQLYGDFRDLIVGSMGPRKFPRPKGWSIVTFVGGKLVFGVLAFGIPLFFHSWWVVLSFYLASMAVVGILLSVVFQLAHCVEEAEFPLPHEDSGEMESAWAVHQIETTVDFARGSRLAAWIFGGLNFQIEHHLFPNVCHVHYPALSKLVEATCHEFGVKYREHKTMWAGVVSHFRWMRRMGRAPVAA